MRCVESLDRRLLFAVATLQNAWTTEGGSATHSGYVRGTTAGLAASERWSAVAGSLTNGYAEQTAVGGGRIYVVDSHNYTGQSHTLTALDTITGQTAWTASFESGDSLRGPTYFNGRVYILRGRTTNGASPMLYALDATDGRTIWAKPFNSTFNGYAPPVANASGIWVDGGGGYNGTNGFRHDGTLITQLPQTDTSGAGTTLADGFVYDYSAYTLSKYTPAGTRIWQYTLPHNYSFLYGGSAGNAPNKAGDAVYVTGNGGLYCVDDANGTLRWSVGVNAANNTVAVANGIVYVPTLDGVRSFSAATGADVRYYAAPRQPNGSVPQFYPPIVTDDVLITQDNSRTLIFNLDGTLRQAIPFAGAPALDHGTLYINSLGGTVHAFVLGTPVRGLVFADLNANGVFDANESGSREPGVGVYLDLDQNGAFSTGDVLATNFEAGGRVQFNVSPGTYTARLLLPAGAIATTATSATVSVVSGIPATLPAFGVDFKHTIRGTVSNDFDANGVADHGPIDGVTVFADLNNNAALDPGEPFAISDTAGRYALPLTAGAYTLRQILAAGKVETARAGGPDLNFANIGRVEVADGLPEYTYDFLSRPPQTLVVRAINDANANKIADSNETTSQAANFVYLDLNGDGIYSANEPSETMVNGVAAFAVDPGTYTVRVLSVDPAWAALLVPARTETVLAGVVNTSLFTLQYTQVITGTVYHDVNGNGIQDNGETATGVTNAAPYLDLNNSKKRDNNEPVATVDASGNFTFRYIAPGTYNVRVTTGTTVKQTAPFDALTATVSTGQTVAAGAFGLQPLTRVSVGVFNDVDADGAYNGSDRLIAGRTVYVDGNLNGQLDPGELTTTTASSFTPQSALYLPTGVYTLRQVLPAGYRETGRATDTTASGCTFVVDGRVRLPEDLSVATTSFTFGSRQIASVTAQAFNDLNGNGTADAEESAATAGGFIYADLNNNGNFDSGDVTGTPTSTAGSFSFNLLPSTYTFRQSLTAGWTQTSPASGGQTVTIAPATTTAAVSFGRWQAPTAVTAVTIDDGTAQRARVRSISLVLNGQVDPASVAAGAFTLTQTAGVIQSYDVTVAAVQPANNGTTLITLTFTGPGLTAGSLANGRYRLTVAGSGITDVNGLQVDAAGTGTRGSVRTVEFFRLASDATGDGVVNFNDFLMLQNAFGTTRGTAGFVEGLDGDNNGAIDFNDFLALQNDFGTQVPTVAPVVARPPSKTAGVRLAR